MNQYSVYGIYTVPKDVETIDTGVTPGEAAQCGWHTNGLACHNPPRRLPAIQQSQRPGMCPVSGRWRTVPVDILPYGLTQRVRLKLCVITSRVSSPAGWVTPVPSTTYGRPFSVALPGITPGVPQSV